MPRAIKRSDDYNEKLLKLIPSEIVAAYLAIQGYLVESEASLTLFLWVVVILSVFAFLYLGRIARVDSLVQKIVATVSFPIWVYVIAPTSLLTEAYYAPGLASIILILWTLLIPLLILTPKE